MRRARWIAMLSLLALTVAFASRAAVQSVDFVNGIGLIDYASKPSIKVGQWVSYRMTGSSEMGEKDDYTVTVMIAGEERFWGEDCFWVETWTEPKSSAPRALATLMSYQIFSDSMPNLRSQYYMRKSIDAINPETGMPIEQVVRRPASTLKKRGPVFEAPSVRLDTLGTDSVKVEPGTFLARKVSWQEGKAATVDQRDSSITTEVRENRMQYFSHKVPVTGLVKESLERTIKRRSWAIGRSQEGAPFITMDRATGDAVLVGMGEGMKSRLLPASRQISLRQLDAPRKAATKSAATAKRKS